MSEQRRCKDLFSCPLADNWQYYRAQLSEATSRVDKIDHGMNSIATHAHHLESLTEIKDRLLDAATGGNHVPLKVFLMVISVMTVIIAGLIFTIVFLLTGEAAGWIGALNR